MATPRYWSANYWEADYWDNEFWAAESGGEIIGQISATASLDGPTSATGSYWSSNYWGSNYWGGDYWSEPGSGGGTTFVGSFEPTSGVAGVISSTLGLNSTTFVGSTTQVEFFDLDVSFTAQWTFTEASTFTGTIANTLEAATSTVTGQFSEDFTGTIANTLEGVSTNFDGTHVAPANRLGSITPALQNAGGTLIGLVVDPSGFTGSIAATTDLSASFVGQYITSSTDGSIGVTLDAAVANWSGIFADSNTTVGSISTALSSSTSGLVGVNTDPQLPVVKIRNRGNTKRSRRYTNTRRKR